MKPTARDRPPKPSSRPTQAELNRIGLGDRPGLEELDHDDVPFFPYKDGRKRPEASSVGVDGGAPVPICTEKREELIGDVWMGVLQMLFGIVLAVGLRPASSGAAAISAVAVVLIAIAGVYVWKKKRSMEAAEEAAQSSTPLATAVKEEAALSAAAAAAAAAAAPELQSKEDEEACKAAISSGSAT